MANSKDLEYYHNKGEEDAAKPSPPTISILGELVGMGLGITKTGNYDPPSDPEEKEAYDKGWENAKNQE